MAENYTESEREIIESIKAKMREQGTPEIFIPSDETVMNFITGFKPSPTRFARISTERHPGHWIEGADKVYSDEEFMQIVKIELSAGDAHFNSFWAARLLATIEKLESSHTDDLRLHAIEILHVPAAADDEQIVWVLPALPGKFCQWHEEEDGAWNAACGLVWQFESDGPEENEMKYCPSCGRFVETRRMQNEEEIV